MAVIQDEQGNNKPIVTDTSHVFDVNGNPLHGELFIGETIASDDVEEIDGYAHMSDVDALSQKLAELDNNNMDDYVNVSSASQSNPYVFPSDGYLRIVASGASVYMVIAGATSGRGEFLIPDGVREPIYVKKGMRFFGKTGGNGDMTAYFWPFI